MIDWRAEAERYAGHLTSDLLSDLGDHLGLTIAGLARFPLLGWRRRVGNPTRPSDISGWTIPMFDGAGRIVGLQRRCPVGTKWTLPGSRNGLYLPEPSAWRGLPGPLLLVEGFSDTATCICYGLPAVGRPSNLAGVECLAELLHAERRRIVVLGENDQKPDGRWPGREGAVRTAERLNAALGRPVHWMLPPPEHKDMRVWLRNLRANQDRNHH